MPSVSCLYMSSVSRLCLLLVLLAHSSRQSPVQEGIHLVHGDVRDLGYSVTEHREGSRLKRDVDISAHAKRNAKVTADEVTDDEVTGDQLKWIVKRLLEDLDDANKPTQRKFRKGLKSKRGIVSEVRAGYTTYYNSLKTLCDGLSELLTADAPSGLDDVGVLLAILKPFDSQVFSNSLQQNERLFTVKFYTIDKLFDHLWQNVGKFVKPNEGENFFNMVLLVSANGGKMRSLINRWQTEIGDGNTGTVFVDLDAGVGGVNSGVTETMSPSDYARLQSLIGALNELIKS